ncbi:ABC transporter ATP-binding protein [Mumia zhuanghuii]|uniref:ABC transporter ATP-binding protein n=1 Tax=Mumia zhuanghuii TaxID=2585211 RepID=A0A5C4M9V2_9ACTN|nr:ABC transporter ATP-binding protein [Mumia zhuanghuii]
MSTTSSGPVIDIRGLVKDFGSFRAVDGLDLEVQPGEVHGFLGPNGAGKSTAVRVLLGLYRRTAGSVSVLGRDPGDHPGEVTRQVSYIPGEVALWPNLTGQEVLDALAGIRGAYDENTEKRLVEEFALDTRRKIRTYSKGNRQKVLLVAAFAARTDLLVLDEPTSGLDPLMEVHFQRCVQEAAHQGRTVLLSSHILSEVEQLCAAVTIIKDGRLVESGRISDMRHLALSTVTGQARRPAELDMLRAGLRKLGLQDALSAAGAVEAHVSGGDVNEVLGLLVAADAEAVTCTPATLDDLFLRHYEVVAR